MPLPPERKSGLTRDEIIAKRRSFRIPGYKTLCDVGFDGDWVTPIQKVSASPNGPVLIGKHWLDAESVADNREILELCGYLPCIPFNKVLDMALKKAGLRRREIYVTQAFHLLPPCDRSQKIPDKDLDRSFEKITRHEVEERAVIALGKDVADTCRRAGIPFKCVPHPSARGKGKTYEYKAEELANALRGALGHTGRAWGPLR